MQDLEKFLANIKKDITNEIRRNDTQELEVVVSFQVNSLSEKEILLQAKRRINLNLDKKEKVNLPIQNEFNF